MDKTASLRKKLTGLITEEIRALFTNSPDLCEKIQAIEEEGFSIDVTIITAVSVKPDPKSDDSETPPILTRDDINFLQSMKLSF